MTELHCHICSPAEALVFDENPLRPGCRPGLGRRFVHRAASCSLCSSNRHSQASYPCLSRTNPSETSQLNDLHLLTPSCSTVAGSIDGRICPAVYVHMNQLPQSYHGLRPTKLDGRLFPSSQSRTINLHRPLHRRKALSNGLVDLIHNASRVCRPPT